MASSFWNIVWEAVRNAYWIVQWMKVSNKAALNTEGKVETMRNLGHYLCILPVKGDLLRAAALSVDNKSALLLAPICALPRSLAAAYIACSPLTRRPPGHHGFQRFIIKGVHRPTPDSYRTQCHVSFGPGHIWFWNHKWPSARLETTRSMENACYTATGSGFWWLVWICLGPVKGLRLVSYVL
jgi:hypothetical protein